jgi:hypothetical protein
MGLMLPSDSRQSWSFVAQLATCPHRCSAWRISPRCECACMRMYACLCVCVCDMHIDTCADTHIWVCVYVRTTCKICDIYTCIYIYIYSHTKTHTHTNTYGYVYAQGIKRDAHSISDASICTWCDHIWYKFAFVFTKIHRIYVRWLALHEECACMYIYRCAPKRMKNLRHVFTRHACAHTLRRTRQCVHKTGNVFSL